MFDSTEEILPFTVSMVSAMLLVCFCRMVICHIDIVLFHQWVQADLGFVEAEHISPFAAKIRAFTDAATFVAATTVPAAVTAASAEAPDKVEAKHWSEELMRIWDLLSITKHHKADNPVQLCFQNKEIKAYFS